MKLTTTKYFLLTLFLSQYLISCTKNIVNPDVEVDAVPDYATVSYSDSTVDFSLYKTVAFADSVVVISNSISKEITATQTAYLSLLKDSLTKRGFIITNKIADADLVLNITKIDNISKPVLTKNYWNNYSNYYNGLAYGIESAKYTAHFNNAQSLKDLMLSFELIDIKNKSTNFIPVVWNGILTEGVRVDDINSVANTVQGFMAQTPNLKAVN